MYTGCMRSVLLHPVHYHLAYIPCTYLAHYDIEPCISPIDHSPETRTFVVSAINQHGPFLDPEAGGCGPIVLDIRNKRDGFGADPIVDIEPGLDDRDPR